MKKFLTLKNILVCAGALLLLVVFFLSFGAKATMVDHGYKMSFNNIIWGCSSMTVDGAKHGVDSVFGAQKAQPAVLQLIGLILVLLAAIGAAVVAFLVKKPWAKWVVLALAVLALAGAIFQFFALQGFARAVTLTQAKAAGITDKETIEQAYQEGVKAMKDEGIKFVMSTLCGVFGIVGALAIGAGALLPEKK